MWTQLVISYYWTTAYPNLLHKDIVAFQQTEYNYIIKIIKLQKKRYRFITTDLLQEHAFIASKLEILRMSCITTQFTRIAKLLDSLRRNVKGNRCINSLQYFSKSWINRTFHYRNAVLLKKCNFCISACFSWYQT